MMIPPPIQNLGHTHHLYPHQKTDVFDTLSCQIIRRTWTFFALFIENHHYFHEKGVLHHTEKEKVSSCSNFFSSSKLDFR
jgi:hypothetical protein